MEKLTEKVNKKIEEWSQNYRELINIISWDEYFLLQAYLISLRSIDAQTQCGAVLVNELKTILSTGYNGFMTGINDNILPNLRPEKYPYFLHAEHNAVLNCAKNGISTLNATAYITSPPCSNCFQILHQAGIKKIIYLKNYNVAKMIENEEEQIRLKILSMLSPIEDCGIENPSDDLLQKISQIKSWR